MSSSTLADGVLQILENDIASLQVNFMLYILRVLHPNGFNGMALPENI